MAILVNPRGMLVFTIELYIGHKFFTDNAGRVAQAVDYAIKAGG
jgi:hypothetical protein